MTVRILLSPGAQSAHPGRPVGEGQGNGQVGVPGVAQDDGVGQCVFLVGHRRAGGADGDRRAKDPDEGVVRIRNVRPTGDGGAVGQGWRADSGAGAGYRVGDGSREPAGRRLARRQHRDGADGAVNIVGHPDVVQVGVPAVDHLAGVSHHVAAVDEVRRGRDAQGDGRSGLDVPQVLLVDVAAGEGERPGDARRGIPAVGQDFLNVVGAGEEVGRVAGRVVAEVDPSLTVGGPIPSGGLGAIGPVEADGPAAQRGVAIGGAAAEVSVVENVDLDHREFDLAEEDMDHAPGVQGDRLGDGGCRQPVALLGQDEGVGSWGQGPGSISGGIGRLASSSLYGYGPPALPLFAVLRGAVHIQVVEDGGHQRAAVDPEGAGGRRDPSIGVLAQDEFLLVGLEADEDGADGEGHPGRGRDVRGPGHRRGQSEGRLAVLVGSHYGGCDGAQANGQSNDLPSDGLASPGDPKGEGGLAADSQGGAGGGDGDVGGVGGAGIGQGLDGGDNLLGAGVDIVGRGGCIQQDEAVGEVPDGGLAGRHFFFDVGQTARRGVVLIVGSIGPGRIVEEQPAHPAIHLLGRSNDLVPVGDGMEKVGAECVHPGAARDLKVEGTGPDRFGGSSDRPLYLEEWIGRIHHDGAGLSVCPGEGGQQSQSQGQHQGCSE